MILQENITKSMGDAFAVPAGRHMDALVNITQSGRRNLLHALDSSMSFVEFDLKGNILNVNSNYLRLSGYQREELLGSPHSMLCPGESVISCEYKNHWKKLRKEGHASGLFRRQRKDGSFFWVEAVYYTLRSENNQPEKIIKFCINVTERIDETLEQVSRLEAVNSSLIMAAYSLAGEILAVNEKFVASLGYEQSELQGKKLTSTLLLNTAGEEILEEIWLHVASGHSYSDLMRWTAVDGSQIWLDTVLTPVFNNSGQLEKILQVSSDVTNRVKAECEDNARMLKLSRAVLNTGHAILISNSMNKTIYTNPAFTEMFGYKEEELTGKLASFILGPAEQSYHATARERFAAREPYHSEEIAYCKNGQRLWVSILSNPVFDADGNRECIINAITDITDIKLYEILQSKALEGMAHDVPTERLLNMVCGEIERIMPGLRVSVMNSEKNGALNIIAVSHNNLKSLGSFSPAKGTSPHISLKAARTGDIVIEKDLAATDSPEELKSALRRLDINSCVAQAIKTAGEKVIGVVTFYLSEYNYDDAFLSRLSTVMSRICSIILERDANRSKMRTLAFYDSVTGLPNRELIIAKAEQIIATRSMLGRECEMAIICLNIDRFTHLSQAAAFSHGDAILKVVSARLDESLDPKDMIGRLFADEFIIISPDCNARQALDKAKRIRNYVSTVCVIDDMEFDISIRMGISMYPDNGLNIETLVANAETSLFQHKKNRKEAVFFFNKELDARARSTLSMEAKLRKAIENNALHLCYQPQICLSSGKIHGVEALCRWNDPELGNVPPGKFIPLAEESGLIEKLSDWVLGESCRQMGQWRKSGINVPKVSVNLSAPNFRDSTLPDKIMHYLGKNGLTSQDMVLELTESVLLDKDLAVMSVIARAHVLGMALSLDDFGTGYSSLSYLRELPLSEIKLDRSFVSELHKTEACRLLSQAVLLIGHGLNLTVMAEGVETIEQYQLLKQHNCHAAQGFLMSRPLDPQALPAWVAGWQPQTLTDQYCLM